MVRRLVLICFLTALLTGHSYAQSVSLDKYTNQLLFNVFTAQPDPSIQDFIKNNIPLLYEKKKIEGVLVTNGSKHTQAYEEVHTYVFTKHPFFKNSFTLGKLEFYCQRSSDPKNNKLSNIKLWFEFDTQLEAEMAYGKLIEACMPISSDKHFASINGSQIAEFSDTKETVGFGKIRIRLTADNLDRRTFKILFETENDL